MAALRRALEEARREAAEYRALVEYDPDATLRFDRELRPVYVNRSAEAVLGRPREAILGRTLRELGLPAERARPWEERLVDVLLSGREARAELEWPAPDGARRYEAFLVPEPTPEGGAPTVLVKLRDVTDRVRVEEALRRSEESLALAQRIARLGNWDWDLIRGELHWSDEIFRLFGIPQQEFGATYEAFLDAVHPEDREAVMRAVDEALRLDRPYSIDHRIVRRDGTVRYVHERADVARDAEGRPLRMIGTVHDITERKRAEEELRRERDFSDAILDTIGSLVVVMDREGRIVRFNRACEEVTGFRAGEVIGRPLLDSLIPEEERPAVAEELGRLLERRRPSRFENHLLARDGTRRRIAWSNTVLRDSTGRVQHVIGTGIDVTALRESERRLQLFQFAVEHAGDIIFWTDPDGRILYANRSACGELGYAPWEVVGLPVAALDPDASPGGWARRWADLERGRPLHFEAELRARSGRVIPVEVTAQRIVFQGAAYLCAFARDVTERRRAEGERARLLEEERRARAEAERANRSKDLLLANLSHEMRTPLTTILLWTQILRRGDVPQDRLRRGLEVIERSARTQHRIVEDLLDISRILVGRMVLERRPLDVEAVVRNAIEAVRPSASARSLSLELAIEPGLGRVEGDPVRLRQVFWNLLTNAAKFTPPGGRIRVEIRRAPAPAGGAGEGVRVMVADTGRGISPDFLPYVFDRFAQADSTYAGALGGLGLGLAIARSLVEMHGGAIRAESPGEGRGATFVVELPAAEGGASDRRRAASDRAGEGAQAGLGGA